MVMLALSMQSPRLVLLGALVFGCGPTVSATELVALDPASNVNDGWTPLVANGSGYLLQTHTAGTENVCFGVPGAVESVSVSLAGGAPLTTPYHHTALPAVMPTVSLQCRRDAASATDTSESATLYDAEHAVDVTLSAADSDCQVCVTGESGEYSAASTLSLLSISALTE